MAKTASTFAFKKWGGFPRLSFPHFSTSSSSSPSYTKSHLFSSKSFGGKKHLFFPSSLSSSSCHIHCPSFMKPFSRSFSFSARPRQQFQRFFRQQKEIWKDNLNPSSIKWRPIPISLGLVVIMVVHLCFKQRRKQPPLQLYKGTDYEISGSWKVHLAHSLPLREISRLWGKLNEKDLPRWLRGPIYKTYAKLYHCKLEEMEVQDLSAFPNMSSFFYRSLKEGLRPIAPSVMTSPADGEVVHLGKLDASHRIEHVKGISYSKEALLGKLPLNLTSQEANPQDSKEWYVAVVYLAPGDYHRIHSPANWDISLRRHFAGELFSVSKKMLELLPNLFVLNERVALLGHWDYGFFSMIPVGATNVGSIIVNCDDTLTTNQETSIVPGTYTERVFESAIKTKKGEEVGGFRLGSTVALVFEAPSSFRFSVSVGDKVQVGQSFGDV